MQKEKVRLHVNGRVYELEIEPNRLLLEVLRQDLGLTGTKRGCDDSSCGACTVLVDGEPQMSCLMLTVSYQEPEITTIEGVADGCELDALQHGFCVEGGAQCGYCTPGILMTAKAFLEETPAPSEAEIREALSGHLCRCTGYQHIVDAIALAAQRLRGSPREPIEGGA